MSKITNSYLIWVGSEHYAGIKDWSDEAIAQGVSKRLPSPAVARELVKPGTVVFVAHDEGESTECTACQGEVDCAECRKRTQEMANLRAAIDTQRAHFKGDWESEAPKGHKRFVAVREARIAKLESECESCATCEGAGKVIGGTGGHIVLTDGRKWDYRQFNYWLHQPAKFDPEKMVRERHMCATCGGTGEKPCARVFGVFLPGDIEYILTGEETEEVMKRLEGVKLVDAKAVKAEPRRGCGKRKPGGTYVVTSAKGDAKAAKGVVKELVAKGILDPKGAEVNGSFVRFLDPIEVDAKRFRGIKKVSMDLLGEGADQAEMIADAIA